MDENKYAIQTLSEMADDFLFSIIAVKRNDFTNNSLAFLHAHALELSAKSACYKLGIDIKKNGHNIMSIYSLLELHVPQIKSLRPTSQELDEYKKTWLRGDSSNTSFDIKNPDELYRMELSYFIDNTMNLKYGITKENIQVSLFEMSYAEINSHFMRLFNTCRNIYVTTELNERLKKKFFGAVGETKEVNELFDKLLNL